MLFDSHAHLAPGAEALKNLLKTMQHLNIERGVVVGGGLLNPRQICETVDRSEAKNRNCNHKELLDQCKHSEGRLFPFYFANPWLSPDEYVSLGASFYGLKIGPVVHGVPLLSTRTLAWIQVASFLQHPVYLHCLDRDGFRVSELVALAMRFPLVKFILGHGGIGHLDFIGVDLIAPHKNIYFETSGAFKAVVTYACKTLGISRVLFGTEYPLQSANAELTKMRDLDLPQEDIDAICGGNIRRILKISESRSLA